MRCREETDVEIYFNRRPCTVPSTLPPASKEVMRDAIDIAALHRCFSAGGLPTRGGQLTAAGRGAVVSVLAKVGGAPPPPPPPPPPRPSMIHTPPTIFIKLPSLVFLHHSYTTCQRDAPTFSQLPFYLSFTLQKTPNDRQKEMRILGHCE